MRGPGTDWSDVEVDLIVADYFAMLSREISAQPYNKAQHNEALEGLISRSRKSIELKHCNISAVLERLGMPIIRGYKPLPHFQNALVDGVGRYLAAKGERSFDPDAMPMPEEGALPNVSVDRAIKIALPRRPSTGHKTGGGKHQDPYFDGWEEDHAEHQAAIERIVERLGRLRERQDREKEEAGWTRDGDA